MTAKPRPTGIKLSPTQNLILVELCEAHPAPLSTDDLIARVYGSQADGGPMAATTTVQTAVSDLRKKLDGTGWRIPKARPHPGRPGLYRIEWVGGER